jgi:hypothetical protein
MLSFCNVREWVRGSDLSVPPVTPLTPTLSPNGERERTEFAAHARHMTRYYLADLSVLKQLT